MKNNEHNRNELRQAVAPFLNYREDSENQATKLPENSTVKNYNNLPPQEALYTQLTFLPTDSTGKRISHEQQLNYTQNLKKQRENNINRSNQR